MAPGGSPFSSSGAKDKLHENAGLSRFTPHRMTPFSAPASIQTDSRASLAPRYIQTRQTRRMSRERDLLSTDQCVASPRYRG